MVELSGSRLSNRQGVITLRSMKRLLIIVAVFGALLTGCGRNPYEDSPMQPSPSPWTPTTEVTDPYEAYLTVAAQHSDWVELTREDAQTRAFLGCSIEWAPGTQDHALRVAYAALCESAR